MTHPYDMCRGVMPPSQSKNINKRGLKTASRPRGYIFQAVNQVALPRFASLCSEWLPGGRQQGQEYIVRNPRRDDKRTGSFKINTVTGRWSDFAVENAKGGDPISLRAYLDATTQIEAARALAAELGVDA